MKAERSHLNSITVLRGLAAFGIVLFHVRIFLWVGWKEIQGNPQNYSFFDHVASWFSTPTPFLGEGVLLFFIISGFCIHYPQTGHSDRLDLCKYVSRRFFRIYPPYAVVVGLSLLAVAVFPWGNVQSEPWLPSLLHIQNYYPLTNSQISSNFCLWSISTEVEFYLLYPLLLLVWRRYGVSQSLSLFGVVSVLAIGLYFYGVKSMAFCSLTFYILWWSGAGLAELYAQGRLSKPSVFHVLLAVSLLITGMIAQLQGHKLVMVQRFLFGGFFIILIWWAISREKSSGLGKTVIGRALLHLGNISYSLYLIHYPLFQVCGYLWEDNYGSKPTNFMVPILFSLLAVFMAHLFYILIEMPSHKLAKWIGRNKE